MHRVDHPTAAAVIPSPEPVGTPGFFTEGDPLLAIPATRVTDDWLNAMQEEGAHLVEAEDLILDKGDRTQWHQAVLRAVARSYAGNLVINGDFQIWQRFGPTPTAGSVLGTSPAYRGPDRWLIDAGLVGDIGTVSRVAVGIVSDPSPSRARFAMRFEKTSNAGGGQSEISTRLENVHTFASQPVVLAFDAQKLAGANLQVVAVEVVQRFGAGGSGDVVTALAAPAGDTIDGNWRRLVWFGTLPTTFAKVEGANHNLELRIRFASQTHDVRLTGVVFQRGTSDPGFFSTPFVLELAKCQRYFEKSSAADVVTNNSTGNIDWVECLWDTAQGGAGVGILPLAEKFAVEKYGDSLAVLASTLWYAIDVTNPGSFTITEFIAGVGTTHTVTTVAITTKRNVGVPELTTPPAGGTFRRFAGRWTVEAEIP